MKPKHRSAKERTKRRIAAIVDELLRCKTFLDYRRSWLMWSDIYELAEFIKASTPRHRRDHRAPAAAKKAGTKSRGKRRKAAWTLHAAQNRVEETEMSKKTYWNYEPCPARKVRVIVGKSPRETWWCAKLEGQERAAVEVDYGGEKFYLDNETGEGWDKVTKGRGGPDWGHSSIPVDRIAETQSN